MLISFKRNKKGTMQAQKVGGRYLNEAGELGLLYKKLGSKEKKRIQAAVRMMEWNEPIPDFKTVTSDRP